MSISFYDNIARITHHVNSLQACTVFEDFVEISKHIHETGYWSIVYTVLAKSKKPGDAVLARALDYADDSFREITRANIENPLIESEKHFNLYRAFLATKEGSKDAGMNLDV